MQKSRLVYNCFVSATLVMQQEWSVIHRPHEYSYLYRATTTEKSHRIFLSFIGHSDFNYDLINVKMALKTLWNSIVNDLIMKCKNVVAGGDLESRGRLWFGKCNLAWSRIMHKKLECKFDLSKVYPVCWDL